MGYRFGESWEKSLDDFLTNPPEGEESHYFCSECKDPLYPGDKVYHVDGCNYCEDCAHEWLDAQSEEVTEEQAFGE